MSDTQTVSDLADTIGRLVDGWYHRERLDNGRIHEMWVPGLIQQLREQLVGGGERENDGPRSIPDSKPPVPEEPFSVLMAMHQQAVAWQKQFGYRAGSVDAALRGVVGHAASIDKDTATRVLGDAKLLEYRAEVVLSWELRSRRLRGKCPQCDRNGTVMVRLDQHGPTNAFCISCNTQWEREKLGLLAGAMGVTP